MRSILFFSLLFISAYSNAQQLTEPVSVDVRFAGEVEKRLHDIDKFCEKRTKKWLAKMDKQQTKILRKLLLKQDTVNAFSFGERYMVLKNEQQKNHSIISYDAYTDSLSTALKFLQTIEKEQAGNLSLEKAGNALSGLKQKLALQELMRKEIIERKRFLFSRLQQCGALKKIKGLEKRVRYYDEQLTAYKSLLHDPKKLEQKALAVLRSAKPFKEFLQQHSELATFFSSSQNTLLQTSIPGLQTRSMVSSLINQRTGFSNSNIQILNSSDIPLIQQQVQSVRSEIDALKNKLTSNKDGDINMPGYKPNSQKTRSFFKRLEYGHNFQSHKANAAVPATTDIGVSIGYKLNDKSIVGIGAAYKLGLGFPVKHIAFSHEGIGLRSFVDIRLKKSFWISGGYEKNYFHAYKSFENISEWQESGLIGITKRVRVKKGKEMKMQLLWDFLSRSANPENIFFRLTIIK